MSDQAYETPMSDHVMRFWRHLETEHVRILIDIRRDHDEGQPPHWDSASFPDDVAKALVAERDALRKALEEIRDHWANQYDHPRKQNEMYHGSYGIGVTDGHRACAIIAEKALAHPSQERA